MRHASHRLNMQYKASLAVLSCLVDMPKTMHMLQLEMILQAQEYEADQGIDLQEFFDSTAGKFKTPLGQAWAKEIIRRRTTAKTESIVE